MPFELGSFLIQFLAVVGGAALFRRFAKSIGQPGVLGELVLGLLLGPSLLGWLWPDAFGIFFPPENRPLMEALGWIGLILFIYTVGAELTWSAAEGWNIFFVSVGGLIIPFILGSTLALAAPHWFFPGEPRFEGTILVGVIMSVSALAVLGRLIVDMGLLGSRLAAISVGASTIDDVVGWILLALVAGTGTIGLVGNLNLNLLLVAALFAGAILADRYLAPRFARQAGARNPLFFLFLLVAIFLSALITHEAGLHAVLGPFAVGAIISRHPEIKNYARTRMGEITSILFLPAFFVIAGMNVDLTVLEYPSALIAVLLVIVVATIAKFVGAFIGGRVAGLSGRSSLELGALLNARGAIGLVVAKVGLDAGMISQSGFALFVVMIAATTFISPLVLGWLARVPRAPAAAAPAPAAP